MMFACGCTRLQFGPPCGCSLSGGCGLSCACRIGQMPLLTLGELRGVIYRASRAPGEVPKNYVHFFVQRFPVLATDPNGRRLYIIGGRFRVTERGIEG
jgi:hypothetical protein